MKKDIESIDDIKLLVNSFYEKVRKDELLGGIFNGVIQDRWPTHLEKMYRFWHTVLLGGSDYRGNPFAPHAHFPIGKDHFDRWLHLFYETLDTHFAGEKTEEARWRAERMATMFLSKIEYFRNRPTRGLV